MSVCADVGSAAWSSSVGRNLSRDQFYLPHKVPHLTIRNTCQGFYGPMEIQSW